MGAEFSFSSIGQGDPFSVFGVLTGRPPKLTPHASGTHRATQCGAPDHVRLGYWRSPRGGQWVSYAYETATMSDRKRFGLSIEHPELVRGNQRAKLVELIAARAPETLDRYAELRSRSRTPAATELIARISTDIEQHEQTVGSRVRQRRDRSSAKFTEALERLVGDLLRARVWHQHYWPHLSGCW